HGADRHPTRGPRGLHLGQPAHGRSRGHHPGDRGRGRWGEKLREHSGPAPGDRARDRPRPPRRRGRDRRQGARDLPDPWGSHRAVRRPPGRPRGVAGAPGRGRGIAMTRAGGLETRASPPAWSAAEVARIVGGRITHGAGGAVVRGAAVDSRTITPGMLFVALAGTQRDGHGFVADAFHRGAAGAFVSRPCEAPPGAVLIVVEDTLRAFQRLARAARDRRPLRVVGITGSVGKTSTKEMAAGVAARVFRTARSPENWNTEIGIPLVLANLPEDREVVVLEMAMRGPGQIRELVEIARPEIGVVTNVGESHLDFFPSRDALAAAKGELIEGLPEDGCAILNADDPLAWALRGRARGRVLAFGLERGEVR